MSGGTTGGGDQSSRPLTAEERQELFSAGMNNVGAYIPKASDYQGFEVIDPSADRGRGPQAKYGGRTGYEGYSNRAPIKLQETGGDYVYTQKATTADNQNAMAAYLDEYFANRDRQQKYGGMTEEEYNYQQMMRSGS